MSDTERWERVKSIFDAAVACEGELRSGVLRECCGDDRALIAGTLTGSGCESKVTALPRNT